MKRNARIKTTRHTTSLCPNCKAHLDAATGVEFGSEAGEMPPPPVPEEGCFTMCAYCGTMLKYGPKLSLLLASREEEEELFRTPDVGDILRARRVEIARQAVTRN